MLPPGHIAGGALLGAWRSRRSPRRPTIVIAASIGAALLPDVDLLLPSLLDRIGVEHRLNSGTHHRWMTHTPLFWSAVGAGARRLARRPSAPCWAPEAASVLAAGAAVHLLLDTVANTVALLWPIRRREYGLALDHLADVTDHAEYVRRYPASPAGKLELALAVAAISACAAIASE
jgi:LexA-binding, inner membrane-associated putative hydrolase